MIRTNRPPQISPRKLSVDFFTKTNAKDYQSPQCRHHLKFKQQPWKPSSKVGWDGPPKAFLPHGPTIALKERFPSILMLQFEIGRTWRSFSRFSCPTSRTLRLAFLIIVPGPTLANPKTVSSLSTMSSTIRLMAKRLFTPSLKQIRPLDRTGTNMRCFCGLTKVERRSRRSRRCSTLWSWRTSSRRSTSMWQRS